MAKIESFTDLIAWKKSHLFVLKIYSLVRTFPTEERFALADQMKRAAVSVTSNIAEGFYRRTANNKSQFYYDALSSLGELQNQLLLSRDLGYITHDQFKRAASHSIEVHKLINGLIKSSLTK